MLYVKGFATAVLVLAATVIAPASASDPWTKLHRPLRIPQITPSAPCPVTPAQIVSSGFSPALGQGPVYPAIGTPTLQFIYPPQPGQLWYGSEWSGQKVLWVARPSYRGPVLIRGRQLDGPNELRFGSGLQPSREMRLRSVGGSAPGGWQNRPSYTRLRARGCYAWQVDGTTFSRIIVFKAELAQP
jgi:hypothetical protein